MRVGVISDVHANRHALEAALEFLAGQRVDGYLCAGDLVGYGPFPNECVERLRELQAVSVAGNHDLIAVGRLNVAGAGPLARQSLLWTRAVLGDGAAAYVRSLPLVRRIESLVLAHGSLDDPRRYTWRREQAGEQLQRLEQAHPAARALVLGHTHASVAHGERRGRLLSRRAGSVALLPHERLLLNPGAVGQSRQRSSHARAVVLDVDSGVASFLQVPYDIEACRRALRKRGLPADSVHRKPSFRRLAGRGLGRLAGAARSQPAG
jgi:predicted phosphodiesterase